MEFTNQKIGVSEKEYSAILYGRQTWVAAQIVPGSFSEGDRVMVEERAGKYFDPTGKSFAAEILSVCEPDEDNEFLRPLHKILSLRLERHGLNRDKVEEAVCAAVEKGMPSYTEMTKKVMDALDPFLGGMEILVSLDAAMKEYFEAKKEAARLWAAYEVDPSGENLTNWVEGSKTEGVAEGRLRFRFFGE